MNAALMSMALLSVSTVACSLGVCEPASVVTALLIALAGEVLMRAAGLPPGTAWLNLVVAG